VLRFAANKQSLEVDWRHMHVMHGMRPVAAACADAPREVLRLLDAAAAEAVFDAYPEYEEIHQDVHVRITGLPVDDSIRDLRCALTSLQGALCLSAHRHMLQLIIGKMASIADNDIIIQRLTSPALCLPLQDVASGQPYQGARCCDPPQWCVPAAVPGQVGLWALRHHHGPLCGGRQR
jgi:hypothetical protein